MKLGSALLSVYMRVYIYKSVRSGTKESMVLHSVKGRVWFVRVCVRFFGGGFQKEIFSANPCSNTCLYSELYFTIISKFKGNIVISK